MRRCRSSWKLRTLGIEISRVHSDQGSEFAKTKALRRWCLDRGIAQTFSEAYCPNQNATAERAVRWAKEAVAVELASANLPMKYWPRAAVMASARQNAYELSQELAPIQFGAEVYVRDRRDPVPFALKWKPGKYLGPTDDVRGGHVVQFDDGKWIKTLHAREVRKEPGPEEEERDAPRIEEGEEREEEERALPRERGPRHPFLEPLDIDEESRYEASEVGDPHMGAARAVSMKAEELAKEFVKNKRYDDEALQELLPHLPLSAYSRGQRGEEKKEERSGAWVTGAFTHGGVTGIRSNVMLYPALTSFLVKLSS